MKKNMRVFSYIYSKYTHMVRYSTIYTYEVAYVLPRLSILAKIGKTEIKIDLLL